jgi:hypothetical protein
LQSFHRVQGFHSFQFYTKLNKNVENFRQHFRTDSTQSYLVEDGSPKGGMSTAKGRATARKFCKGDIRPRGQWPKY